MYSEEEVKNIVLSAWNYGYNFSIESSDLSTDNANDWFKQNKKK